VPFDVVQVALGIALAAWGIPAAHRLKGPAGIMAACSVPAGVILALSGTLMLAAPGFFKG